MQHQTLRVFILLSVFSCGQKNNGETVKKIEGWKTFSEANHSIAYPPDWHLDTNKILGTSFIIYARSDSEGKFRENINLLVQNLQGLNLNLNKYVEVSEQQIGRMILNPKLIESKRIKDKGTEYHQIIYTGDNGPFHLKFKQYYWVLNDKAYVLTFTGTQDTYDEYLGIADQILNSFKITEQG